MRFTLAPVVLSALVVSTGVNASSLHVRQSAFPSCAMTCIANADLGGCEASDAACTCKNTAFVNSVTKCIFASCSGNDLTNAISTAQAICRAVGVTFTSTPVSTSSAASASATGASASLTQSGSATGSAASSGAPATVTTKSNAASSNGRSLTLAGASSALGLIALSFCLM